MPVITLPQGRLNVRVAGPEESGLSPVVFLHPILTDGALWRPVAERLAERGVRSYAPDWPLGAHVLPLEPDADRSPAGVARMVSDFLAALDLRDVTLVGNDTGGAIAQYVVDAGDERVSHVVLMNCDAFDVFPPFLVNLILGPLRSVLAGRVALLPMRLRPVRHSWLGFGLLAKSLPAELTRSWIEPALHDRRIRFDLSRLLHNIRPAELQGVTSRLARATVPITVLWGTDDRVFRPSLGRRLADTIGTDLVTVDGARTLLALDAPDAVVAAICTAG